MSWRYYPESSGPRATRAGIKARSARGAFGQTPIGRAWEGIIGSDARVSKARSYARKGQVIEMSIDAGVIKGAIQGSRARPYSGSIRVATFKAADWSSWLARAAAEPALVAELLDEQLGERALALVHEVMGEPLVPTTSRAPAFECSCPDYVEPCKHVAALHLLITEQLDDHPTLMLMLRGLDLEHMRATLARATLAATSRDDDMATPAAPAARPLPVDPDVYWGRHREPLELDLRARLPASAEAVITELGLPPLWHAEQPLEELLAPIYRAAGRRGVELLGVPEEQLDDAPDDS